MSSAAPTGDRSPAADSPAGARAEGPSLPELVRQRGAALLDALERHLPGSREHAEGTASYALIAATHLGYDAPRLELVREAAKLHEIGKVYLPAGILAKPISELSVTERAGLDRHFLAGAQLAAGAGIPTEVCAWIRAAGERYDGAGPGRLAADAIPSEARVIHAACVCDELLRAPAEEAPVDSAAPVSPSARAANGLLARAGTELDPASAVALADALERAG
jgi:HD-GYP domain-containing protein (c-di-GMP phosphodiesterase class II)